MGKMLINDQVIIDSPAEFDPTVWALADMVSDVLSNAPSVTLSIEDVAGSGLTKTYILSHGVPIAFEFCPRGDGANDAYEAAYGELRESLRTLKYLSIDGSEMTMGV